MWFLKFAMLMVAACGLEALNHCYEEEKKRREEEERAQRYRR